VNDTTEKMKMALRTMIALQGAYDELMRVCDDGETDDVVEPRLTKFQCAILAAMTSKAFT
jgi:hypothetical protein